MNTFSVTFSVNRIKYWKMKQIEKLEDYDELFSIITGMQNVINELNGKISFFRWI